MNIRYDTPTHQDIAAVINILQDMTKIRWGYTYAGAKPCYIYVTSHECPVRISFTQHDSPDTDIIRLRLSKLSIHGDYELWHDFAVCELKTLLTDHPRVPPAISALVAKYDAVPMLPSQPSIGKRIDHWYAECIRDVVDVIEI